MNPFVGLAELYFKLAVRGHIMSFTDDELIRKWYRTTIEWIDTLSVEDKVLILKTYSHWNIAVIPDERERIKLLAAQFARDMEIL